MQAKFEAAVILLIVILLPIYRHILDITSMYYVLLYGIPYIPYTDIGCNKSWQKIIHDWKFMKKEQPQMKLT